MSYDLIVASNLLVADNNAVHHNGWKRVSHNVWEKPDGTLVKYVANVEALMGSPRGTILYLGAGWWNNPNAIACVSQAEAIRMRTERIKWDPLAGERDKKC
jgi:hypothetical protein